MQVAVGLLGGLDGDLLLQEMRPIAQRDDLGIEPIEPLAQPRRGDAQRELLAEIELEPLNQRAQDHELPV